MPLLRPRRPFLDWTIESDLEAWGSVPAAIIGLLHSEHYRGEARPK